MLKPANIMVMGGIAVFLAWGVKDKNQTAAATRVSMVSTYQLNAQQASVYDDCLDTISHKHLKNGGDNASFCGCFAKSAADDDSGVKYSVDVLRQAVSLDKGANYRQISAHMTADRAGYFPAFIKSATAAAECIKDQQHTFASNDERVAWCAAKPERTADRRCRPL